MVLFKLPLLCHQVSRKPISSDSEILSLLGPEFLLQRVVVDLTVALQRTGPRHGTFPWLATKAEVTGTTTSRWMDMMDVTRDMVQREQEMFRNA